MISKEKYKKEDWVLVRAKYAPTLFPFASYFSWPIGEYLNIKRDMTLQVWDNGFFSAVVSRSFFKDRYEGAFKILWNNKENMDVLRNNGINSGQHVVSMCKDFSVGIESKRISDFPDFFEGFISAYQDFVKKNMILCLFGGKEVERRIAKNFGVYGEVEVEKIVSGNIFLLKNNDGKTKISEEDQWLLKIMKTVYLMKGDRDILNSEICHYFNDVILKWVAFELNLTLEEARYLDPDLVRFALNDGDAHAHIKKRMDIMVVGNTDLATYYYEGEKGKKVLEDFNVPWESNHKEIMEVRGMVASKGKCKGRVCVLNSANTDHFKNGDVLVAEALTPDLVALMKKSSAVITDEGGITCHAAVISRELKIPCIVDAKNASRVLKSGDKVDVDADEGVVKIIEKKDK